MASEARWNWIPWFHVVDATRPKVQRRWRIRPVDAMMAVVPGLHFSRVVFGSHAHPHALLSHATLLPWLTLLSSLDGFDDDSHGQDHDSGEVVVVDDGCACGSS